MASCSDLVLKNAQVLWDFHDTGTALEAADVIIGLGSYDLRVADRCADLLLADLAPKLVFSGASGNWTQGKYPGSEAAAFARRAVVRGVQEDALVLEPKATNIGENIAFSRHLVPHATSVIWVTKPQTQRRVSATLALQWPEVRSMVTSPCHLLPDQPTRGHPLEALISEMVGDTWRLVAYADKGYSASQIVPDAVGEAFDSLVASGFTGHLPGSVRSLDDR